MSKIAKPTTVPATPAASQAWPRFVLLLIILLIIITIFWQRPTHNSSAAQPLTSTLPAALPTPTITVLLGGDVSIGRNIGAAIEQNKNPELPFANLHPLFYTADIVAANLECPLSDEPLGLPAGLVFRCLVKDAAGLLSAGFKVLFTANNHAFDQGLAGLLFTAQYLHDHGILAAGTGQDFAAAHAAQIFQSHNVTSGFLSYSYSAHNDGGQSTDPHLATMTDLKQLKQDIQSTRGGAEVIIVNMHAGTEYTRTPTPEQIAFAHAAIDAGADVVVGEHPHWIQTMEIYKGHPIFYSLGNLIFDQSWSRETTQGLMIKLTYQNQTLKTAQLLPIIIEHNSTPRLANPAETERLLKKIGRQSPVIDFSAPN